MVTVIFVKLDLLALYFYQIVHKPFDKYFWTLNDKRKNPLNFIELWITKTFPDVPLLKIFPAFALSLCARKEMPIDILLSSQCCLFCWKRHFTYHNDSHIIICRPRRKHPLLFDLQKIFISRLNDATPCLPFIKGISAVEVRKTSNQFILNFLIKFFLLQISLEAVGKNFYIGMLQKTDKWMDGRGIFNWGIKMRSFR